MKRLILILAALLTATAVEAQIPLRQSTQSDPIEVLLLDSTDGVTPETALTISQADIRVSKNGGGFAQTNNVTGATHDENGWYTFVLDATDTNTVGTLTVSIQEPGALPVWVRCTVMEEAVYDVMLASSAVGPASATTAANIESDTQNIQTRVPLPLSNGQIAGGASTTTTLNVSMTPTLTASNMFVGSRIRFLGDVTGQLKDQCVTIVGSTNGSPDTLTVDPPLTVAPADLDTFTVLPGDGADYATRSADTGATQIARTGADADTLETLSDQADTIVTDVGTALTRIGTPTDLGGSGADVAGNLDDIYDTVSSQIGVSGVVTTGSTSSLLNVTSPVIDATNKYVGLNVRFATDTSTTELQGQARRIIATTDAATDTIQVYPAFSTPPLTGDTFVLTEGDGGVPNTGDSYANQPANFSALGIEVDGDLTKVNLLDGHTPQTGDSFARIGATGAGLTSLASQASVNTVDTVVDTILVDTAELQADWVDGGRLDLLLDDVPTGAEFNARTLLAADYYDPVNDNVIFTGATLNTAAVNGGLGATILNTAAGSVTTGWGLIVEDALTGHIPQTGDSFARLGAPAGASHAADILAIDNFVDDLESRLGTPVGASLSADLAQVESQTDDIGVAGAGLTAVPWNAAWDADVESEVSDGLTAYGASTFNAATDTVDSSLTQILGTPFTESNAGDIADSFGFFWNVDPVTTKTVNDVGVAGSGLTKSQVREALFEDAYDLAATASDGSAMGRILDSTTNASLDWVQADDSLQAISEGGGGGPTVGQIADAVWDEATAGHTTAGTFGEQVATDIDAILVDTSTGVAIVDNGITDAKIATDAIGADELAGSGVTEIQAGIASATAVTNLQSDVTGIQGDVTSVLTDTDTTIPALIAGLNNFDPATDTVDLGAVLGTALVQSSAGRIAGNLSTFYDNANAATSKIVDDVGSGAGGAGDWTATELAQLRYRWGIDGAESAPTTNTDQNFDSDSLLTALGLSSGDVVSKFDPAVDVVEFVGVVDSVSGGINTGSGVITTLDGLDSAQDVQHAQTQSDIAAKAAPTDVDASLASINLNHWMKDPVTGADVGDNSALAKLASKAATADWDTFSNTTDAHEAIRDRGDAAWLSGGGGGGDSALVLADTTVQTVTSDTQYVLSGGPPDDHAMAGRALAIFTDASDATQKAVRRVTAWDGSGLSMTVDSAPDFTITAADGVVLIADDQPTAVEQTPVTGQRLAELQPTAGGLTNRLPIPLRVGDSGLLCAANFSRDLPPNTRVEQVNSIVLQSGAAGGVVPQVVGSDHAVAKFRMTAVTAGSYVVRLTVTYSGGAGTRTADVNVEVVE